jgi:CDP-glycerol glycerophosphotransferase (TagB/SpsB family)
MDTRLRDMPEKGESSELKYCLKLIIRMKFDVVFIRCVYNIVKKLYNGKKIWLFFDRVDNAKDNAEALYSYCNVIKRNEIDKQNVRMFFILDKKSKDYIRLKKQGFNVINFNSLKHKVLFLLSEKIISVQTTYYVYNIFSWNKPYYADLYKFKYIFLQHGVIHSDLSSWLNSTKKKIDLFITTSDLERDSIINNKNYGFGKDIVKTLGLARYDKLCNYKNNLENTLLIMPTWRSNIIKSETNNLYKRVYCEEFKNTEYFKFFNSVITSSLLLDVLEKRKYKIKVQLHPNMIHQARDFTKSKNVIIFNEIKEYSQLLLSSKLLVTDYSSIAFDFAYLKKPIVYCQYDVEDFYDKHTSKKGYFDYVEDGFGKVTRTVEETVNEIIKLVENECKMEEKYVNRVDNFFKYIDCNNCERIYNEILKLK